MTKLRRLARLPVLALTFVVAMLIATAMSAGFSDTTGHNRSDQFWRLVTPDGMAAEEYETPSDMSKSADLVVVGRIESVSKGREWVAAPELLDDPYGMERAIARFATATIKVEEVLGPTAFLIEDERIPVELYLYRADLLEELRAEVPGERAIFALRNKGPDDSLEFFRLVNDSQGVIREFGDRAHMQADVGSGFEEAEGLLFERLVEAMRDARVGG